MGEFLKAEREKKGIRLSDISSVTKIPVHNLKLMEEGKWKTLPAKPFVKGFLTAYAKYIGLNGAQVYQRYLEETAPSVVSSVPSSSPAETSEISKTPLKEVSTAPKVLQIKPILISLVGVVFLASSVWLIQLGKQTSVETVAALDPSAQTNTQPVQEATIETQETSREPANAPESPSPVAPVQGPAETSAPVAKPSAVTGHELEVNPKELTWVKVVIDEAPPVNLRLKPEEKTKFSAKEKIKLVLGNATGSEVLYNGSKTDGKLYSGTIRYYIFPVGSTFPQDQARKVSSESAAPQESDISTEANQETTNE